MIEAVTPIRQQLRNAYGKILRRWIEQGQFPNHVAVIQDGNRRYARTHSESIKDGHRTGAATTEAFLDWMADLGIDEVTLYAFSTENFDRPDEEQEHIFNLLEEKLREFATSDRVHEQEVCIRAIGDAEQLPQRVQDAIGFAEMKTQDYDSFHLNIALAYGGRNQLLRGTRRIAKAVENGELSVSDIDVETVANRLYATPIREVDLVIRSGGEQRTSNFLPWLANGNEAVAVFIDSYWPAFSKIDLYRAIHRYQVRENASPKGEKTHTSVKDEHERHRTNTTARAPEVVDT